MLLTGERLLEAELDLVNTDLAFVYFARKGPGQLSYTLIGGEGLRLYFILIGFLIERQTISGDWCINSRAKVSIFFDDIPLLALDLNIFACFVHLTEHLDPLPLDLRECPLLILGLFQSDLLGPLRMLLLSLLLSLNQSTLKKVESFILKSLDIILAFVPFADLLILHQAASEGKTSLIRCGGQGIVKCALLSHLVYQLHLSHAGRKTLAIDEILDSEDFRHAVSAILHILWGEWVSLGL